MTNQIFEFRFSFFLMNFSKYFWKMPEKNSFFYKQKFIEKKLNRNSKIWLVNRFSLISWLKCFLVFKNWLIFVRVLFIWIKAIYWKKSFEKNAFKVCSPFFYISERFSKWSFALYTKHYIPSDCIFLALSNGTIGFVINEYCKKI